MSKYYICSIGDPEKDYDEENLHRCIIQSGFYLHENCSQKGKIAQIQPDDVLILKYRNHFFAYGRASHSLIKDGESGWCFKIPVEGWITGKQVHKSGIQSAQVDGSNYDAVKEVERSFARDKISAIGVPF